MQLNLVINLQIQIICLIGRQLICICKLLLGHVSKREDIFFRRASCEVVVFLDTRELLRCCVCWVVTYTNYLVAKQAWHYLSGSYIRLLDSAAYSCYRTSIRIFV